jgi:serine/threonine protein kinase/formylglycine-generating enzyme required for sulfatase activity
VDIVIDQICDQLKRAWQNGGRPTIESFLDNAPTADRNGLLYELLRLETALRQADGDPPDLSDYLRRFPSDASVIQSAFDDGVSGNKSTGRKSDPLDVTTDHSSDSPVDPSGLTATMASTDPPGETIGRYRTKLLLGEGAFGSVWLGYDEELRRSVAIKVPKPERFRGPQDAEAYLAEARTVASLDHPHIVPVYDVGRTAEGSIYVVSKYIEGCTLADRIGSDRMPLDEITKLLTTSAQALHHAHGLRLIHRDIKPANILVEERTGTYYVADFGLAIREEDHLRDGRIAGTPAYMSPEQVRGEGHRLDGRSDVFALGVMMYELLTGKRPFRGSTANEIYHQIISVDPQPPRSLESDIPEELQRICLKALAKRAADRYATAAELADDLSNWQQGPATLATERTIIPKGLRSFDADDADFFLDLLPGPRDRSGLPASLRFWKTRIEARESEQTFNVGLIYGPSGCGKSSLVKAGLIPRLSKDVIPLYIEATPDETETRILRALQKHVSDLPANTSLAETFAILRRRNVSGMALATGSPAPKIVIIVDQFEQWLHAHRGEADAELVAAFRQCDGAQVQAIVMVRDDFAMAAARFMDMIEVPIVQGKNFTTVDLFDIDHAEQVFTKFGRAFGKLPAAPTPLADHEQAFVSAVVGGLADEGQVVSVRLSLFAEMVKSKPWTMQTLLDVGGTDGIGVNFLEETFSSRNANPTHRLHEQAARAVLRSLLPDVTTDIKGHMRSHAELLADSGYESRPAEFNALLRILDGELRLISPTDPEGANESSRSSSVDTRYFQLTHDYMVPSLREWLTRKQQETRAGRAELKLAERTNLWTAKPENRYLPSLAEWFSIRTLTDRKRWTTPQQSLMQRATRVHSSRIAMGLAASVLLLVGGLWTKSRVDEEQARTRVAALLSAETRDVPRLVNDLTPYRQWADPELQSALESPDIKTQLHARIALLPVDPSQVEPLQTALLDTTPENVLVLREALLSHGDQIAETYWPILQSTEATNQRRLSAGSALAKFAPDDGRWQKVAGPVSNLLVNENPLRLATWIEAFRPVREPLIPELGTIFRDQSESVTPTQRELATNLLETYAADNVAQLSELIIDAQPKQFAALFDEFTKHKDAAKTKMREVLDRKLTRNWNDVPIDPKWRPITPAMQTAFKQANGLLDDHFAYVQKMPLDQFEKYAQELRQSGYRPTRLRPYAMASSVAVAATWTRDGRDWRIETGCTEKELREKEEQFRKDGFNIVDACPYMDPKDNESGPRYAALWLAKPDPAVEARLIVCRITEFTSNLKNMAGLGLSAVTSIATLRLSTGDVQGCSVCETSTIPNSPFQLPLDKAPYRIARSALDVTGASAEKVYEVPLRWRFNAWKSIPSNAIVTRESAHAGERCVRLSTTEAAADDLCYSVNIDVEPSSWYLLSGWIKTENVQIQEQRNAVGATLALERSTIGGRTTESIIGTNDWQYRSLIFSPSDKSSVVIAARLGFVGSTVSGTAWYDDLCLVRIDKPEDPADAKYKSPEFLTAELRSHNLLPNSSFEEVENPPLTAYIVNSNATEFESVTLVTELNESSEPDFAEMISDGFRPFSINCLDHFLNEDKNETSKQPRVCISLWRRPNISSSDNLRFARHQASAAAALARFGEREEIFASLRITDDPESLTQFVHRCREQGVTPFELIECLGVANESRQSLSGEARKIEDRVLFGLLLALGEFPLSDLPGAKRSEVVDKVADWFASDPSSTIHGATGWLLRQWGQTDVVKRVDQTPLPYDPNREWFTLAIDASDQRFYQTYVVIQPGEYEIGSPVTEPKRISNETIHRVRLTRPVAILDREVTRAEYEASGEKTGVEHYSPTVDHPTAATIWYDSVRYCRWLSEKAGFAEADQAYSDPKSLDKAEYQLDGESGFPRNWPVDLAKQGFRLPTEAEWEIAARGGMKSMYGFGGDVSMLNRYALYLIPGNNTLNVAKELRPNFRGLFDMHGNVNEWCHDWHNRYSATTTQADPQGGQTGTARALRGGSMASGAANCRSAYRNTNVPTYRNADIGLRLALSLSVQSPEAERVVEPVGEVAE